MPVNKIPRIEIFHGKKFIGKRLLMSLSENRTGELWRSFMQQRRVIMNSIGTDLYSIQFYDPHYFTNFNPSKEFEKWAAVEVPDFASIPEGMEPLILRGGNYAVFIHKGGAAMARETYQYIFGRWLPGSEFLIDDRAHFEILGEKYKNEDPESEEEIWIPVKPK
jgi:AraC family transcriptional regulator